jgi:hypothetical protein
MSEIDTLTVRRLRDEGVWRSVDPGTMHTPQPLPNDGSWACLAGQEVAGEFLSEMGRTLHVSEAALDQVDARLSRLLALDAT